MKLILVDTVWSSGFIVMKLLVVQFINFLSLY